MNLTSGVAVALIIAASVVPLEAQTQPRWLMRPVPPLPSIAPTLPPLGLQTATMGQQPTTRPPYPDGFQRPTHGRPHRGERYLQGPVTPFYYNPALLVFVPYLWGVPPPAAGEQQGRQQPAEQAPKTGTLVLDIQPAEVMQIYLDGYYVGSTAEFANGLDLEAGNYRVELRASGYDPLAFGVNIRARQATRYRDSLKRSADAARDDQSSADARSTAPPMPLYVIAGCYAGNVPPTGDVTLPPGCDRGRVIRVDR